jgi:hypothetical protein
VKATNLADLYGSPLLDWANIESRLAGGVTQVPETGGPSRHMLVGDDQSAYIRVVTR